MLSFNDLLLYSSIDDIHADLFGLGGISLRVFLWNYFVDTTVVRNSTVESSQPNQHI